ncbi:MAG: hypothetical protein KIS96_14435 [Bauldia sp.]|nr:hypothetical protein [Bauldia sp.]
MAVALASSNDAAPSAVEKQRQRSQQVWNARSGWDALYREAYDLVLPNRRPGGQGKTKHAVQQIFDMTGPNSAMHCAGEIQRQIFPAATPFVCETGPLVASRLSADEKKRWDAELNGVAQSVYPYFKAGDFDTAVHEMCTDLTIGTGVLLPMRGPSIEQPLVFMCIPQDEVAVSQDAWNRVNYVSWKRKLGREAIIEGFPRGVFTDEFRQAARSKPYEEVDLWQDWFRTPFGTWALVVYLDKGDFVAGEQYRTQPVAVARFYRLPGEAYGRGPVLFALPTIRTANKAQELTLKAFAIQMLGIWGYRAGGTFNPDTVRVGPGEFWPMQSTGGVLGPDAMRLDTASGRVDLARLVIPQLQTQIREALLDTRIFDDGGTPPSASEMALRAAQNAKVHLGAYGRLNRETVAVIVPRAMEILNEWRLLPNLMTFNELLMSMYINSPMAAALKADELSASVNYWQLTASVVGPERVPEKISEARFLDRARRTMLVPPDIATTPEEEKAAIAALQQQRELAVLAEGTVKAAPQIAGALLPPAEKMAA